MEVFARGSKSCKKNFTQNKLKNNQNTLLGQTLTLEQFN